MLIKTKEAPLVSYCNRSSRHLLAPNFAGTSTRHLLRWSSNAILDHRWSHLPCPVRSTTPLSRSLPCSFHYYPGSGVGRRRWELCRPTRTCRLGAQSDQNAQCCVSSPLDAGSCVFANTPVAAKTIDAESQTGAHCSRPPSIDVTSIGAIDPPNTRKNTQSNLLRRSRAFMPC